MCYEKGHTGLAQMSIESERTATDYLDIFTAQTLNLFCTMKIICRIRLSVELYLSEQTVDEPLDFIADIDHYQLRKRL